MAEAPGIHLWASENIFNKNDVALLSPQAQQPLLLTMNCLNGNYHFPYFNALSEELVKANGKGAIAAFSPSGLSLNTPAHLYHKALLTELISGSHERLGDAVLAAQESYAETGAFPELLRIYHLLGDPALTLSKPLGRVRTAKSGRRSPVPSHCGSEPTCRRIPPAR